MPIRLIKKMLNLVFKGVLLPVFSPQLKGMYLKINPVMATALFWHNVEEEVHSAYNIFIKKDFLFFDIGANVGLHSYYVSRRFENSQVYAFEPFPANANYIREMTTVNKLKNITIIEKAVGEKSRTCYFDALLNNHQGHVTNDSTGLKVEMISLDDFLAQHDLRPNIIKMDVEGGETAALSGFKNSITKFYPIMIIELHGPEQTKNVADFFRPLDYTLCRLINKQYVKDNKPFQMIDNSINTPEPPPTMYWQIVAVPTSIVSNYSEYIRMD